MVSETRNQHRSINRFNTHGSAVTGVHLNPLPLEICSSDIGSGFFCSDWFSYNQKSLGFEEGISSSN